MVEEQSVLVQRVETPSRPLLADRHLPQALEGERAEGEVGVLGRLKGRAGQRFGEQLQVVMSAAYRRGNHLVGEVLALQCTRARV